MPAVPPVWIIPVTAAAMGVALSLPPISFPSPSIPRCLTAHPFTFVPQPPALFFFTPPPLPRQGRLTLTRSALIPFTLSLTQLFINGTPW